MSEIGARFGVWSPVSGGFGPLTHPQERPDASWEHNKNVILLAEKLGFDSTLVAQHTISTRARPSSWKHGRRRRRSPR